MPTRGCVGAAGAGALLGGALRDVGLADRVRELSAGRQVALALRRLRWTPDRARPEKLVQHLMVVRVARAPWARDLALMKNSLLELLHGSEVRDLRFIVGALDDLLVWEEETVPAIVRPSLPLAPEVAHALVHAPAAVRDALAGAYLTACRSGHGPARKAQGSTAGGAAAPPARSP